MKKIIAFGEVLYDVFNGGANAEIGGAPFNFCAGVSRLGDEGYLLSSVGDDEPGKRVTQEYCKSFGVKTELVSVISKPTGVCLVTRGADGEPAYDLKYDAAYDNIPTPEKPLCADLFYFGTLAQRSVVSRKTLYNVLENGRFGEVFFDVNLRMNFFDEEIIRRGLEYATILKVNLDECHYLCKIGICRSKEPQRENIQSLSNCAAALMSDFDLNCVIITLDKDGAFAGRK